MFVVAALLGPPATSASAQKTDVIRLRNGNVIVGEVKLLELGLLQYSVDHIVGRLRIKWEHVLRLTADKQLDIELADGRNLGN